MANYNILNRDELYDLYINKKYSQKQIANYLKCSKDKVSAYLIKYDIHRSKINDLTGKRFGKLLVLNRAQDYINSSGTKFVMWHCICDCGNECDIKAANLTRGKTNSCGCYLKELNSITKKKYCIYDLSGDFGIGYTAKGEEFYFDLEDYEKIKNYCWSVSNEGYLIARKPGNGNIVKMHQIIMDAKLIDHIKHNKLDNRKSQLRKSSDALNARNRSTSSNNTSGRTGVNWNKKSSKWQAYITVDGKWTYLGMFSEYDDAVKARRDAEKKYYGEWSYIDSINHN